MEFHGNVYHDVQKTYADDIRGIDREELKDDFKKNLSTPSTQVYGGRLNNTSDELFASGNRENAGKSSKVIQQVKSEVTSLHRKKNKIHQFILDAADQILLEDKADAKKRKEKRKIWGCVQNLSASPSLKIVLFTESTICLYHKLCQNDIVYIDATGRVTLESKDYKRILLYPLCVRHPYSKTPPLPTAQYLSSNHNVESIASFFTILQEKEKNIFNGKVATPGLIMTDYSLALILSCLSEFSKESLQQYVNKSLRIIQGKATTEKLNSTILHICFFHTMNLNWWNLQKHLKTGPKQVNV